ncbi:hypothetical protein K450DRAFT_237447 [Umbelopsis ramanniana AG]|uniref:Uncharacterized protein n=1 Tax=Umbelopsis ramanniana AG TaxID=1314678 RepID=A0AAD5EDZ7_UMBRA|nr:uncharacterized protein K450DRAFT_237447 [Umbelopsis ramanniana AG]KAI8580525.1 hypothetical protein K450DRAFT_237447 [Umbelopsis ramanniana AG]
MNPLQTFTSTPRTFAYDQLIDIKGRQIDIRSLATQYYLVVISLKSVQCPVCPVLLQLINMCSGKDGKDELIDPFTSEIMRINPEDKEIYRILLQKDAYYIVICPGPSDALSEIARQSEFEQYPFIADDEDLSIAKTLKLNMSNSEMWPSIIHVIPESLSMLPLSIGRGPGNYGIMALLKGIMNERAKWERKAFQAMKDASTQVDRTRRKMKKWQDVMVIRQISNDNKLPSEILYAIIAFLPDIRDVIKMREVSLLFNITACEVVISKLRHHTRILMASVPPSEEIELVLQESLRQWRKPTPILRGADFPGLGQLRDEVKSAERSSLLVNQWIKSARPTLTI